MKQSELPTLLSRLRIMPVVVIDAPERSAAMCRALAAGGLPAAEVTLRTPGALAAIEQAVEGLGDGFAVGAGSVRTADEARRAIDAGSSFIVSPGFDEDVVDACKGAGIAVLPGIATATEGMRALRTGVQLVKFFPAVAAGGQAAVRALSGPLPELSFVPTGGVTAATASEWLQIPQVVAVGGTWLTPQDLIASGEYAKITEIARNAMATATVGPPGA